MIHFLVIYTNNIPYIFLFLHLPVINSFYHLVSTNTIFIACLPSRHFMCDSWQCNKSHKLHFSDSSPCLHLSTSNNFLWCLDLFGSLLWQLKILCHICWSFLVITVGCIPLDANMMFWMSSPSLNHLLKIL